LCRGGILVAPVNWVLKAALQKAISALPNAESANYLFQRRVTRSLPIGDAGVGRKFGRALRHFRVFGDHGPARPPAEAVFYEFGAGWDLAVPLSYAALGVGRQVLVDVRPNLRLELVNATLASLARQRETLAEAAGLHLRDLGPPDVATVDELEERFGIAYLAPRDARATGLPGASVHFVSSTNTLEHVPERDIPSILRECARLLRPDGVMSFRIDMQDHASYSDPRVSPYHFLRFSDRAWRLLASALAYQNRLRLPDYRRLFREAGLETLAETVTRPTPEHLAALARVELAPRFRAYARDELAARALEVVVRPRSPDRGEQVADLGDGRAAGVRPRARP
jgi:SAM-dependent methyltransferase